MDAQNTALLEGPLIEETQIMSSVDYYKPTMSQFAHKLHDKTEVTFTFKNRGKQKLINYVDPLKLQKALDALQEKGFSAAELNYLASINSSQGNKVFDKEYLDYISNSKLPNVDVSIKDGDLHIESTGEWSLVTYWETVVMSLVNEMYFDEYIRQNNIDTLALAEEGKLRLDKKIKILQNNPDIIFSDSGTRRRFSLRWQKYVVDRLKKDCLKNFSGTSNVGLAASANVPPKGTFAHEMPMVYAGLADAQGGDIKSAPGQFMSNWFAMYGEDLAIALTDTYGTGFFFSDFTPQQARDFKCLRQDSGDPISLGEKAIEFYEDLGIDPLEKTIVFSDGLDIDTIVKLHNHFKGRINVVFGWGTTLTNDLGLDPLNIVMKATHLSLGNGLEAYLVKLSDDIGKHTGPQAKVDQYEKLFALDQELDISDVSIEAIRRQLITNGSYPGYTSDRVFSKEELGDFDPELRLHPWFEKMISTPGVGVVPGKGRFFFYGPNYAADPIILRQSENGLEVLLIQRPDTKMWAFAGGFIEKDEDARTTALREAFEETGVDFTSIADTAVEIYKGIVSDLRTTAFAWPETTAIMFDATGVDFLQPQKTEESLESKWFSVNELPDSFFGSHSALLAIALDKYLELHPEFSVATSVSFQL